MELLQDQADAGVAYAIEKMEEAPTEYNEFYWWAFSEIITERPLGMSLGPIPNSKIQEFCNEWAIWGYERYVFTHCMRQLDNRQLKVFRERSEKRNKAK